MREKLTDLAWGLAQLILGILIIVAISNVVGYILTSLVRYGLRLE